MPRLYLVEVRYEIAVFADSEVDALDGLDDPANVVYPEDYASVRLAAKDHYIPPSDWKEEHPVFGLPPGEEITWGEAVILDREYAQEEPVSEVRDVEEVEDSAAN